MNPPKQRIYMWLAVLATLLIYLPVVDNPFINWDDDNHILHNIHIRHLDFSNLKWMFTHSNAGYWIPLTWLSYALDYAIGRLEPWVYHLDNLVLHCLNTALVFRLALRVLGLARIGKAPGNVSGEAIAKTDPLRNLSGEAIAKTDPLTAEAAFGTALLFGLHPLHVESVAWAAERKDLLCGLFSLLSLLFYLQDASRPRPHRWRYWAALSFLVLALLSKPMAVSLPLVFILLDLYPLGRLGRWPQKVLWEKIPFFLAALAVSWIVVLTKTQVGAEWGLNAFPLWARFLNASHSLIFYLVKILIPHDLAAFYPLLMENLSSPGYVVSAFLVLLLSAVCFIYRKKYPFLGVAWLFYILTLAPTLGFVQVGNQAAADRFTYLASLAPFLLIGVALTRLLYRQRLVLILLALGLSAYLGVVTLRQISVWKDSISLWENVLRVTPKNNLTVFQNLGQAYEEAGRLDDALAEYSYARGNQAGFFYPQWAMGRIFSKKGQWDLALRNLKEAMEVNPHFPPLHADLGMAYERKGMGSEAIAEVQAAIRLDPRYAEAYNDLGLLYKEQGQWDLAMKAFQQAWNLDPDNADYFRNLVEACRKTGAFQQALALDRDLANHPQSLLTLSF